MIKAESVTFSYRRGSPPVLTNFSACFNRSEITAIRGVNGCGKTTLTKLLVGILRPSSGRVLVGGTDISKLDLFEIGQRVGYVFQNPERQLFCDTVLNEISFGLKNQGLGESQIEEKVNYYLEYFGLSYCRNAFPGKLSLGEKQRLALSAVLALGTDYLVLDEPTSGLDIYRQRELGELLCKLKTKLGCGIVFVSHEEDFINRCADRELVFER